MHSWGEIAHYVKAFGHKARGDGPPTDAGGWAMEGGTATDHGTVEPWKREGRLSGDGMPAGYAAFWQASQTPTTSTR